MTPAKFRKASHFQEAIEKVQESYEALEGGQLIIRSNGAENFHVHIPRTDRTRITREVLNLLSKERAKLKEVFKNI
jgi:hypothetical protein